MASCSPYVKRIVLNLTLSEKKVLEFDKKCMSYRRQWKGFKFEKL